jgi:hypothetical protein
VVGDPSQPIAPQSELYDPLGARELARAMFEVSRSDPKQNARQRLKTIGPAYLDVTRPLLGAKYTLDYNYLTELARRWQAAELVLCQTPAERAAAYQRCWEFAWGIEGLMKAMVDAGREPPNSLHSARYERLRAEMEWKRAAASIEKTRPLSETYPVVAPPAVPFEEGAISTTPWAKALFEDRGVDLDELARQRVEAIRTVYRTKLRLFLLGKAHVEGVLDQAGRLTEAELAAADSKAAAAAAREKAWEMAWITDELSRRKPRGNLGVSDHSAWEYAMSLTASRYALLHAEVMLVQAGQARRLDRVSTFMNEPDLAKFLEAQGFPEPLDKRDPAGYELMVRPFDRKAFVQARAELRWANLDDLLRQRLETAREGYRTYLSGQVISIDIQVDWLRRLLEAELGLANSPAARKAVFARHWRRVRMAEAIIKGRYDEGREPIGSLMEIRYARLETELMWAPWEGRK